MRQAITLWMIAVSVIHRGYGKGYEGQGTAECLPQLCLNLLAKCFEHCRYLRHVSRQVHAIGTAISEVVVLVRLVH